MTEAIPEQRYSKEKFDGLYKKYSESEYFFSEEALERAKYLRGKYPNATSYAFFHILGASGIDESTYGVITHEDFPGEDSVEMFIDNLTSGK